MSYLNVVEVESAIQGLCSTYPHLCELITLPNSTHEGRTTHAIRIALGPLDNRPSMLFIGGQHAREWGSCEICINFAADLIEAYDLGTGISYGGMTYSASEVRKIIEYTQVFVFPCVNPDGRNYSQFTEAMWRKNRNPANGVDLNRNYDFLWDFETAFSPSANPRVSDNPDSNVYHGTSPESEPETKNVVWLLDSYPQIRWFIDIHSYGQLLYIPWGDDENQTVDQIQNFLNVTFDGARGIQGDAYGEYLRSFDLNSYSCLVNSMQSAILAVRGLNYTTGQSYSLYPTSGTATDYPYSRHFADPTKTKVMGILIEWGTEFQPSWTEMENIILDISSALVSFVLMAPCNCSYTDANLLTPTVIFNDVPEDEMTSRAIVFSVFTCSSATFQIITGPDVVSGPGAFGTIPGQLAILSATTNMMAREAKLWLTYTGQNENDVTIGTVTVRLVETGEEWIIPISANTIARPTVGSVLVLDQSASMDWQSGIPGLPTRKDVLKFAAPVFVNLLHENNGIGVVAFDHDAYDRMNVQTVGPVGPYEVVRNTALGVIATHTPNPAGNTAIGDGVEKAHIMLGTAAGFDKLAMVVFTDGHETSSKYIGDVASLINEAVFAIGLGTASQIQPAALTVLTNNTGGYLLLTGTVGPDDLFLLSKYYLQILAGVTNSSIVLDPESAIKPGQIHRIPFHINEADSMLDVILLGETDLPLIHLQLESPSGDIINPTVSNTSPGLEYVDVHGVVFYRITIPVPLDISGDSIGRWHAMLKVDDKYYKRYLARLDKQPERYKQVVAHGVRYSLNVLSRSGFKLQARVLQGSFEPGAKMTVRATLSEYDLPVEEKRAQVNAEFNRPDGTRGVLPLKEEEIGTGIYINSMIAEIPGIYSFRIQTNATTLLGNPVTREHLLTGAVWDGGDNPRPGGKDDAQECKMKLCELLACLLNKDIIQPELEKRLVEQGINVKDLRKCIKKWCKP